ncbi:hypothetical protein GGI04_001901 [Coemansia thaxteri]|uniref:lipoyl(octanoyl) transferase n=1 Tax=Coemansia thaxteri TaxID=2663907 RepID=A0A9W8BBA1_9FUNG|nr:hypothetical protein H4R26_004126 [Coemansia thaxteri]KAJ2006383.1 hypothetical protein GGI04_001901 [Coemansia thaxteri]KAJ2470128.1 hypothetical protein GGI02_003139 [Coemansia sp. RSA 2322]KAJ2486528.1 hypothetical protein EV174_001044 [Coemansia sp. RSA 2320]
MDASRLARFASQKISQCTLGRSAAQLSGLPSIGYVFLGEVPYVKALTMQKMLCRKRIDEIYSGPHRSSVPRDSRTLADCIILLEHKPVYTNGRRNHGALSSDEIARLESLGCDYVETNRGGEITFHGPGQLVAYPNLYLKDHSLGTKCYVEGLEHTIIEACARLGVDAGTIGGYPGVWASPTKKIAALGTHVQKYVTSHGFALNCTTDMKWFSEIVPCGLQGKSSTSLASILAQQGKGNVDVSVNAVLPTVVDSFSTVFGCNLLPLEDLSPKTFSTIKQLLQ